MMRERNDPEGWTALDTRQSATCIVINWTGACAATCIGIDSPTLFELFLAQKVGESAPMDTATHGSMCKGCLGPSVHGIHINYM